MFTRGCFAGFCVCVFVSETIPQVAAQCCEGVAWRGIFLMLVASAEVGSYVCVVLMISLMFLLNCYNNVATTKIEWSVLLHTNCSYHWREPLPWSLPLGTVQLPNLPSQSADLQLLHFNDPGIIRGLDLCNASVGGRWFGAGQSCLVIKPLLAGYLESCFEVM